METKEIIQALKCCHNLDECDDCEYNELGGFCEELLKRDAAERLEKLEAELEKRTINDRPYEWISVEDEPVPRDRDITKYFFSDDMPCVILYYGNGEKQAPTHWMRVELPKSKEPTFKDVFFKAFPKAAMGMNGSPEACLEYIFPYAKHSNCVNNACYECWNQPYFESKEEGEGDA